LHAGAIHDVFAISLPARVLSSLLSRDGLRGGKPKALAHAVGILKVRVVAGGVRLLDTRTLSLGIRDVSQRSPR
jgi:hypothetical protein